MSENLYDLLAGRFPADRSRPAFLLSDGGEVSYGALERGAGRIAARLIAEGAQPGDRVALQAEKSVEAVMAYLGVLQAGCVFLPLNAAYTPAEVDYFRADAEPRLLIGDPADFLAGAPAEPLAASVPRAAQDLAAIIYTSGTTGRSKGAMLSHGNLAANALALYDAWGFSGDDVLLHALPIFHVHGLFVALHCALLGGCPMVWLPKFAEGEVLRGLERATVMMGVPTFYTRLLETPAFTAEGAAGRGQYAASKAAMVGLARSWAIELAPRGVTVRRSRRARGCTAFSTLMVPPRPASSTQSPVITSPTSLIGSLQPEPLGQSMQQPLQLAAHQRETCIQLIGG